MNKEETLVAQFYDAFARRDFRRMNDCYAADVVFFDPVFQLLKGVQVTKMWEMLCTQATDFTLTHEVPVALDHEYVTCGWTATYTFSATGKKVVNQVKAHMRLENGKIIEHSDGYSLHKWSHQALGFSGWLLGWNRFFQRKIQLKARKKLLRFIEAG